MINSSAHDLRSARLDIAPILHVDFVHGMEIVHVGEKDVHLDNIVNRRTRRLQHKCQVLDNLVLYADLVRFFILRNLTRPERPTVCDFTSPSMILIVSPSRATAPEQKTMPCETIAWLYMPGSAFGALFVLTGTLADIVLQEKFSMEMLAQVISAKTLIMR